MSPCIRDLPCIVAQAVAAALVLGACASAPCFGQPRSGDAAAVFSLGGSCQASSSVEETDKACPSNADGSEKVYFSEVDGSVELLQKEAQLLHGEASISPAPYNDRQRLNPVDALRLYQAIYFVTEVLERHSIPYFAGFGTLLGTLRNKGVIPHDDDFDFHILRSDVERLNTSHVRAEFDLNGLELVEISFAPKGSQWQIYNKDPVKSLGDIFALVQRSGPVPFPEPRLHPQVWYLSSDRGFPLDVMEHLEPYPFGNKTVMAPSRTIADAHLSQAYGPDWETSVNCNGANHNCILSEEESWDLTGMALPCSPIEELAVANTTDTT